MSTTTPPFLVGTAISVYQNSGGDDTNWSQFEAKRTGNGRPTIKGGVTCGKGAEFWERYEEDIERAASLKLNSFRLSIEWNRIEPVQGKTDEAAVARYHQILDCLKRWDCSDDVFKSGSASFCCNLLSKQAAESCITKLQPSESFCCTIEYSRVLVQE